VKNAPKIRLLVLGGGFAAVGTVRGLDFKRYDVTIISSRDHFLFTPLLPSTTVGTIEFRSIMEPLRKIRDGIKVYHATAKSIDVQRRCVVCHDDDDRAFDLSYDRLLIAVGAWNSTYNVPGVKEHALFLKELSDARKIRERVTANFEQACVPTATDDERKRLLSVVIVGGGPTGVEFAAELNDLLQEDLAESFPELAGQVKISLFEAGSNILTAFDQNLRDYTKRRFKRQGIELRVDAPVSEVGDGFIKLKDGTTVPAGLVVWSTGNTATSFAQSLPFEKDKAHRILTDQRLLVKGHDDIYAAGDCAQIENYPVPQTAQVALQQGKYLSKAMNKRAKGKEVNPFKFHNLGMLAYVGDNRALADIPKVKLRWRGVLTYLFWRSAYLTRLVRFKNKVLVAFDWFKTFLFGRDLSRF
jgi:NADH:quinone reductase (non-electrogenic)